MHVKVYVVEQTHVVEGSRTCHSIVAVRLTLIAARAIAREKGGRRVTRWVATKDLQLISSDAEQHVKGGQHGSRGLEYRRH